MMNGQGVSLTSAQGARWQDASYRIVGARRALSLNSLNSLTHIHMHTLLRCSYSTTTVRVAVVFLSLPFTCNPSAKYFLHNHTFGLCLLETVGSPYNECT